jgi:hypothetical protein
VIACQELGLRESSLRKKRLCLLHGRAALRSSVGELSIEKENDSETKTRTTPHSHNYIDAFGIRVRILPLLCNVTQSVQNFT